MRSNKLFPAKTISTKLEWSFVIRRVERFQEKQEQLIGELRMANVFDFANAFNLAYFWVEEISACLSLGHELHQICNPIRNSLRRDRRRSLASYLPPQSLKVPTGSGSDGLWFRASCGRVLSVSVCLLALSYPPSRSLFKGVRIALRARCDATIQ